MASLRGGPVVAVLLVLVLCGRMSGQEPQRSGKKRWLVSVAVLAAATAFDAAASMGRYEANPLLRNGQGQFSASRSALLKTAGTAGLAAFQALVCRKDPRYYRASAVVNFASAGAFTGMAVRSLRMPP